MKPNSSWRLLTLLLGLLELAVMTGFPTPMRAQPQQPSVSQRQASLSQRLPSRWQVSKTSRSARGAPGNREGGASRSTYRPKRGAPDNREGGASRSTYHPSGETLVALIPETNIELTVAKYPTFLVYVPANDAEMAEFVLLDENNRDIYRTTLTASGAGTPGVVSISLPASAMPPLEIAKDYHWYFSLIYQPQDRSKDTFVEGWIQRTEPSPRLVRELAQAAPRDRVALYAESGIWYETLTTLAELRRSNPNDSTLSSAWAKLLGSIGLNKIAK